MKLHQQITDNVNTIRAFETDSIRVNNKSYTSSLIVTADSLDDWPVDHPDQLSADEIRQLAASQPEIIIIGTGLKHCLLDQTLMLAASQLGIGIEIMTTEAACRTYNILLGEDRTVLAALIIEKSPES